MSADAAILSLIADLYGQIQGQGREITMLRENLKQAADESRPTAPPLDPLGGPEEADRAARTEQQ